MARPPSVHPTDGELEILRVLWANGPTALSVVCETLRQQREVATTTIATMLKVMREKGLVQRLGSGRGAQWTATITQKRAAKKMVSKLVDHVFDGSADLLAAHLIEGGQLSREQLVELRDLIDQRSSEKSMAKKGAKR
ncbi:MAG: BlaI/MecI/CopY family transcriptional regulator [Planctomycetes bacterium]|nr:BlaI/MecI/CopY family transcriptional regulator [Planctomycetota bacterium]